MNLRIIIVVVVKTPFFLAVFVCVSGTGEWDLIPLATFPGWEAMHWVKEWNNFPSLWTRCDNPWNPKLVSYVLTAPRASTSHPKRVSFSLRVSRHRLLFVLAIKELWLNYTCSPDPCFSGLKDWYGDLLLALQRMWALLMNLRSAPEVSTGGTCPTTPALFVGVIAVTLVPSLR